MPRKASENIILRQEQISLEGMTFNTMMKAVTTVLPEVRERERERAIKREASSSIYLSTYISILNLLLKSLHSLVPILINKYY